MSSKSVYPESKQNGNIIGPVTYVYLEGDPGDGISRKILLLGDSYTKNSCTTGEENFTLAEFFRFMSVKTTKLLDLFIEEDFGGGMHEGISLAGIADSYLQDIKQEFVPKNACTEPMRIHYADVRTILDGSYSLIIIYYFLCIVYLSNNEPELTRYWLAKQPTWDSFLQTEIMLYEIAEEKRQVPFKRKMENKIW